MISLTEETIETIELLAERLAEKIVTRYSKPEQYIHTDDLIKHTGVTPQTVSRWIRAGMPYEKGRPNRFKITQVEKWLAGR